MQAVYADNAYTGMPVPKVTIGGPTDELLAVITVDTTNVVSGISTLDLGQWGIGTGNENDRYMEDYTAFSHSPTGDFGAAFIINEGWITMLLPEPDALVVGLLAASGLGIVAVRRWARRGNSPW